MRIAKQFSLRNFLIVTALLAVWCAVATHQLNNVKLEKRALQELTVHWKVEADSDLRWRFKEPKEGPLTKLVNLPARKLLGDEKLKRVHRLRLVSSTVAPMVGNVRKTYTPDVGGPVEVSAFQDLRMLAVEGSSARSQAGFDAIGTLKRLESLRFWGYYSDISRNNIQPLAALKQLKKLSIKACKIETLNPLSELELEGLSISVSGQIPDLGFLSKAHELKALHLCGELNPDQLVALEGLPQLERLSLDETNADGRFVDSILKLKLQRLTLGEKKITMPDLKRLLTVIPKVVHWGLVDFKLDENYFQRNDNYYELDMSKCGLYASLSPTEKSVQWSVTSDITERSRIYNYPQILESPEFRFTGPWRELPGKESRDVVDISDGNLCNGVHTTPVNNVFKFVSRENNIFHIRLNFQNDWHGATCELDVHLPFEQVNVYSTYSLEEAKELFSRFFDPADFETPRANEARRWRGDCFSFKLKESLKK